MSKKSQGVVVVDSEKRFLEYTNPGMARKLLRENKAKIFSKSPFAIMLHRSVSTPSRRKSMAVRNYTTYFKEEKDIYVQNLANAQVSCEFPMGNNRIEGFTFPYNREPINLSQHIPFEAIKASMDFRKMLARRPPALQLLSEEDYNTYYAKRAESHGLVDADGKADIDAAIDIAEEKRRRTADKSMREDLPGSAPQPIHKVTEKGTGPGGAKRFGERDRAESMDDIMTEEEAITPRVLHLCNQVKPELEESERMSAKELRDELESIPDLTFNDYSHIRATGFYKSIKNWARGQMDGLASANENVDG